MKTAMKSDFFCRWITIFAAAVLVAACGFHLRGSYTFSFDSLYINFPRNSATARMLKRQIEGMESTNIVDTPKRAVVILSAISEKNRREELTYNTQGRVREYSIYYDLEYMVRTRKGKTLIEPTKISLRRTMTYDDSEAHSKEYEIALLYKDMHADMAQRLMRRLASIHLSEEDKIANAVPKNSDTPSGESDIPVEENEVSTERNDTLITEDGIQFEEVF